MSSTDTPHAQSRRRPVLLTGTGLGLLGLGTAGVIALAAGSAAPAFAVTKNTNGTVAITLSDLSALPALNQKLTQEGIPVVAVPMEANCTTSMSFAIPRGHPVGRPTPASAAVLINPSHIPSGQVGVVGVMHTTTGRLRLLALLKAPAPGPSCLKPPAVGPAAAAGVESARGSAGPTTTIASRHTKMGTILVGPRGQTLYLFNSDQSGASNCYGRCARGWPPLRAVGRLVAKPGSGVKQRWLSSTRRRNGTLQVTYEHHPLYVNAGHTRPGSLKGDHANEFGGRWYVVPIGGPKSVCVGRC